MHINAEEFYFRLMLMRYVPILFLLGAVMLISIIKGKLTVTGSLTGGLIGFAIFLGAGYTGVLMIGLFFILGTAATSWQLGLKERLGVAEKREVKRTAGQVIANGGVAGIIGILSFLFPQHLDVLRLMMAAALSSATADTLSSEMGNVYGSRFYNILSFKKDKRGLNGVISAEGTLFGVAGSILIAIVYCIGYGWSRYFLWIVIAGTIGNLTDSYLGATLERWNYLNNNAVNCLNTLFGALVALLLFSIG